MHSLRNEARTQNRTGSVRLHYRLSFADLYWALETSYAGMATTLFFLICGLGLLSTPFVPGNQPVAADVMVGIVMLVAAPILAPVVMIAARGIRPGAEITLAIDASGVSGWPSYVDRDTSWMRLTRPRMERRVLVLPFSFPSAFTWVVIPARALTERQFDELLRILQQNGHLCDGNRQSPIGRLLAFVTMRSAAHLPGGCLSRFPILQNGEVREA